MAVRLGPSMDWCFCGGRTFSEYRTDGPRPGSRMSERVVDLKCEGCGLSSRRLTLVNAVPADPLMRPHR